MDRFHNILEQTLDYSFAKLLPIVGASLLVGLILHGLFARSTRSGREVSHRRGTWAAIIYIAFWVITAVLAITSFGSIFVEGKMEHQALLVHIMAAGAFTAIMVAFAYSWNPALGRPLASSNDFQDSTINGWWVARWSLWLVLLSSLGVAASMLFGMLPLFDTQQMLTSIALHRYFGLLLIVGLVVHLYSVVIQLLGWR